MGGVVLTVTSGTWDSDSASAGLRMPGAGLAREWVSNEPMPTAHIPEWPVLCGPGSCLLPSQACE